ncbi:MAG: RHS repeat domain-containing protein, partial [Parahaliea sp.]
IECGLKGGILWRLRYNAADRLTSYRRTAAGQGTPDLQANYQYDPFGRRIAKHVTEGGTTNTTSTYFIYSEQGLLGETDQDGTLTKAYGFNPVAADQGLWSTDPIWQASIHNGSLTDARTEMHYLHTDHLGTPLLATTKAGQTSWQAQAEAFGAAGILPGNRIRMNLRLPGQYFDGETGLHYNYFRDYDPSLGRYVQSDLLDVLSRSNDPQLRLAQQIGVLTIPNNGGLNHLYNYAEGNPINRTDPSGLLAPLVIPGICAAGGCEAIVAAAAAAYCALNSACSEAAQGVGEAIFDAIDDATDGAGEDGCGCWRILEPRNSWWDGDRIYYEYLECLRECREEQNQCGN